MNLLLPKKSLEGEQLGGIYGSQAAEIQGAFLRHQPDGCLEGHCPPVPERDMQIQS